MIRRTVRLIGPRNDLRFGQENLSLRDFESDHGYVLLGEPGMGKSTCFTKEADRIGAAELVVARRFIGRNPQNHPEWRKGPLFIDGLDEVRVGQEPRSAIDTIINHLETLGNPQFRLSCRTSGWLGNGDLKELSSLTDFEAIPVLDLNPLSHADARQIVSQKGFDAHAFITEAYEHSMEPFLFNPQLLDLLLISVEKDGWPDNPSTTFKNACRELIKERNSEHRDTSTFNAQRPSVRAVISAAGQLSALMLIANKSGWSVGDSDDPEILSLRDVDSQDRSALREAFYSNLFRGSPRCRTPIHRLLVEFLGARYLAEKIQDDLTVQRVLALFMGHDGIPFRDLRD